MKKILIILFLFISFYGHTQYKIHIGETPRSIYTYYKNKGQDIQFLTFKTGAGTLKEELILYINDVYVRFNYSEKNICYNQYLIFQTKEAYYKACDYYQIDEVYGTSKKIVGYKKYKFVKADTIGQKKPIDDTISIWEIK